MIAKVHTATLNGIDALPVVVEVDLVRGDNRFILVGLPDKAVQESEERVRTAIRNSDMVFPNQRSICNLAPGDIRKEGPSLDLPIAIALLAASGQVPLSSLEDTLFLGEMGRPASPHRWGRQRRDPLPRERPQTADRSGAECGRSRRNPRR